MLVVGLPVDQSHWGQDQRSAPWDVRQLGIEVLYTVMIQQRAFDPSCMRVLYGYCTAQYQGTYRNYIFDGSIETSSTSIRRLTCNNHFLYRTIHSNPAARCLAVHFINSLQFSLTPRSSKELMQRLHDCTSKPPLCAPLARSAGSLSTVNLNLVAPLQKYQNAAQYRRSHCLLPVPAHLP